MRSLPPPFCRESEILSRFVCTKIIHVCSIAQYMLGLVYGSSFASISRYEMMLVCAAKTAASALRLPRGPGGNGSLLSNGAIDTTSYAYSLIQSRSNRRKGGFGTSKGLQCVCKVIQKDMGNHEKLDFSHFERTLDRFISGRLFAAYCFG